MPGGCFSREFKRTLATRTTKPFFYIVLIIIIGYILTHGYDTNQNCNPMHEIEKNLKRLEDDNNNLIRQITELDLNRLRIEKTILNMRDELNRLSVFQDQILFDLNQVTNTIENNHREKPLNKDEINELIDKKIETFSADKTGLADFALESAGGAIISQRDTENFPGDESTKTYLFSLGKVECELKQHAPNKIIQPGSLPGECWAFTGQQGSAIIRLIGRVFIRGITLEHIPRRIAPSGDLYSAPKEFSIWGLKSIEDSGNLLGRFTYLANIDKPLQYFTINQHTSKSYCLIEFKVHSNYGHPNFTCVYRLRVHGLRDQSLAVASL